MRVTPGTLNIQVRANLQRALSALAKQQDHLSSGKRVLAPSDDPGVTALGLVTRSRRNAAEQFKKNIGEARTTLETTDQVLQSAVNTLSRAKELAIQGANDTNGAQERQSIAREIDQLLEATVALSNERNGRGEYIFGGRESTTAPYTVTRNGAGQITAVTANPRGIDTEMSAEVSEGVIVGMNVSGTTVFGALSATSNAFDTLIRLRDDLNANRGQATQNLTLVSDLGASGAANANAYLGVDTATDFQIAGYSGTAYVRLTTNADDTVSAVGHSTSAIATAAAINSSTGTTGVTATATAATFTVPDGAERFDALNIDGAVRTLRINGQNVVVNLNGASQSARRQQFIDAVNAQVTGVVASAGAGNGGLVLTAADGRNISVQTSAGVADGDVAEELFGFTTAPTTESVVARGGVRLTSTGGFTTTETNAPANQIGGEGLATGVSSSLADLDAVLDRIQTPMAQVGGRLNFVALLEERLTNESLSHSTNLSRMEDLDIPKAAQEFQQMQTFYEAALASGSNLLQLSLLNFLK